MYTSTTAVCDAILDSEKPGSMLRKLHILGVLKEHLPEVDALYGVPQREEHHPEVDTGWHIELCLDAGKTLNLSKREMYAVLLHDVGKAVTTGWPRHHNHEILGVPLVSSINARVEYDDSYKQLALLVAEYHLQGHQAQIRTPKGMLAFLEVIGVDNVESFMKACHADAAGRLGHADAEYSQRAFVMQYSNWLLYNDLHPNRTQIDYLTAEGQAQHRRRVAAYEQLKQQFSN